MFFQFFVLSDTLENEGRGMMCSMRPQLKVTLLSSSAAWGFGRCLMHQIPMTCVGVTKSLHEKQWDLVWSCRTKIEVNYLSDYQREKKSNQNEFKSIKNIHFQSPTLHIWYNCKAPHVLWVIQELFSRKQCLGNIQVLRLLLLAGGNAYICKHLGLQVNKSWNR